MVMARRRPTAEPLDGWAIGSLVCRTCGYVATCIIQVAEQQTVAYECSDCGRRTAHFTVAFPAARHVGYFETLVFTPNGVSEWSGGASGAFERES